jgi:hypothetical protein
VRAFVAIAAISWWLSTDARAECKPTAVMLGDPTLAQTLSQRLAANGIATSSTEGCPVVKVSVRQRGDQVHLELTDSFSRRGERQVRDVATAAAIVESWTLQEVDPGSLPELAAPPAPRLVAVALRPTAASGLAAMFESSVADDGSLWLGGAASGCGRVGPLCVGGLARLARDTATTPHRSNEVHALATIDLPRAFGRFAISPGIGVGYGWLEISSTHLDMHMMPFEVAETSHALRADVHLTVTRSLGKGFAIYGDVRGDSALARTDIPAGPSSFVRAAIGLRVEAR